jgi:hypothetical protein
MLELTAVFFSSPSPECPPDGTHPDLHIHSFLVFVLSCSQPDILQTWLKVNLLHVYSDLWPWPYLALPFSLEFCIPYLPYILTSDFQITFSAPPSALNCNSRRRQSSFDRQPTTKNYLFFLLHLTLYANRPWRQRHVFAEHRDDSEYARSDGE